MGILPIITRFDGAPRKFGIELEYTSLGLLESVEAVEAIYGGQREQVGKYRYKLHDTPCGTFTVELDVKLMHQLSAHFGKEKETGQHRFEDTADALLSPVMTRLSPTEIITPPLQESELEQLEQLVALLRDRGARGTGASVLNAYGLHINTDAPSLEAAPLLAYLQAFVLLQDWLTEQTEMDLTRLIAQYAKLYPEAYAKHILQPSYHPTIETLIDDYLSFNPSRDRALDMLPLFAYIDESRVRAVVKDMRVQIRPTFHFRMPNCRIDEADWHVRDEILHWGHVEKLANDHALRQRMSEAFLADTERLMHRFDDEWPEQTARWLALA
jgi:hypothetical protein